MLTWFTTKSKNQKKGKLDLNMSKAIDLVYKKKNKKIKTKNIKDLNMVIHHRLGQKTNKNNNKQKQKVENLKKQK